ncbi:Phosphoribosyl 1,2-cyclic phosphodiesterase [Polaromonas sp. OV174]|uniref:MBL fold metallo-hydrolase n=1 Tax=Polaromonas sp. OV174 TaxID=1855300 RepID=UPI0008EB28F5|nr:MBL fold metallo-hydrolase [Polaromonas sp. OV174]SFC68942.1 Phosphoribosyl 1,2-cyclic phosphodiesterase [Polaromonas sp. OV174]
MLRFKSLGSGSTGNATLVEASGTKPFRLLIDCGLGLRQLQLRLGQAGLQPEDLDAVFITHEHGDHIGCALSLTRRYRIPIWMSHGTHSAIGSPDFEGLLHTARDGEIIALDGLQLTPFTVPHDAREPLQLSCSDGSAKFGILTDLGHATAHVLAHLESCDALLLECNHDSELLAQSAYPSFLKRRVGGQYGHLSNAAAADIARAITHKGLKHLVAAHLSAQNNRPDLVQSLLAQTLSCGTDDIMVASPDSGTCWLQL